MAAGFRGIPDVPRERGQEFLRRDPSNGKYEEAEGLYNRTLAIVEKAMGPSHPDVATSLLGLTNNTLPPMPAR